MIKARLLSTAAVALTFGVAAALNAASAQTNKPNPEPAPAAQQNAPPSKIAPSINAGEHKSMPETIGQSTNSPTPGHIKADENSNTEMKGSPDRASAADKSSADVKAKSDSAAAKDTSKDASKSSAAAKSSESSKSSTTGHGAAGAVKLSSEQRTKITTVIKRQKVKPVTHVNFSINIGTRVPTSVHYYPLPVEVVTIYPEWRGFDYILVGDQIIVIEPGTHEIVAILEA